MNRVLLQSLSSTSARCNATSSSLGARRFASTGPAGAAQNSNLPTVLLGVGVLSAAGYYYLSRQSPETLAKAESKVKDAAHTVEGKAKDAANKVSGAAGSAASAATNGALDPSKFLNFKLKEVKPYNHNTSRFIFELPEGQDSGLSVASALLLKPAVEGQGLDGKGKPAIRPYTPISSPDTKGEMEFLIKAYPNGALTQYMHNELKPGMEMAIKGPLPKHQWKANEFDHVGMVAGGTGITPMWQVMQAIDSNPADKTKVTLLFANLSDKDILLKEEFDRMAKNKPDQFKIVHVIEKGDKSLPKDYLTGRIGHDILAKNLPLPGLADKTKIFVCGPPPMVEVTSGQKVSPKDQGPLKGFLADLGYQPEQVYKF